MPESEEERNRKIIIDSKVARAANRGIHGAVRGNLTSQQLQQWTALDEDYLRRAQEIAPDLLADLMDDE